MFYIQKPASNNSPEESWVYVQPPFLKKNSTRDQSSSWASIRAVANDNCPDKKQLNLSFQVDAGLSFRKKDLENSFIFDIKTIDRVFYLVADTEEDMNKWVRNICDICGFNPTDEGKDGWQSSVCFLFFLF